MKIVALVLALFLGACATVQNPITPDRLYAAENGAIVVFAGLNAYKQNCMLNVIPQSCRKVIAKIQVVTRQIPPYMRQLRTFVRNNDQINAVVAYNEVQKLIAAARNIQIRNGAQ